MNGASASTLAATTSTSPVRQRKTTSGTSHLRPASLRHSPPAPPAIEGPGLPMTIHVRARRPPFFIPITPPPFQPPRGARPGAALPRQHAQRRFLRELIARGAPLGHHAVA